MHNIKMADTFNLKKIQALYEEYRHIFHLSNSSELETYLTSCIDSPDTAIFYIEEKNTPIAFIQVNITNSSIFLGKMAIVSDLYVIPSSRKKGLAKNLLSFAFDYAMKKGCKNISATSPISNLNSQDLLKKIGMKKDNNYFYYNFNL